MFNKRLAAWIIAALTMAGCGQQEGPTAGTETSTATSTSADGTSTATTTTTTTTTDESSKSE